MKASPQAAAHVGMRGDLEYFRRSRQALVLLSMASIVALSFHRSESPTVLGRYGARFAMLLGSLALLALSTLWVCASTQRFAGLCRCSLRQLVEVFFLVTFPLASAVDFLLPAESPSSLAAIGILAVALVLPLASRGPSDRALARAALVLVSVVATAGVLEASLRFVILDSVAPMSETTFARLVEASWTRPHPPSRAASTFRILGVADSFGWTGGADNYNYQLEGILAATGRAVRCAL
jgi:hypothetical protein